MLWLRVRSWWGVLSMTDPGGPRGEGAADVDAAAQLLRGLLLPRTALGEHRLNQRILS